MKRAVAVALLIAIILGLYACSKKKTPALHEEDIRAVCKLATLECYYNNVAKHNQEADNIFQKDRKMWIEYEGKATIGINMAEIEIDINAEIVSIDMPKAEILSIDYTFGENPYISSTDGWIVKNEISTEAQEQAVEKAQEEMEQQILNNKELFLKAEDRAKELIAKYIDQIGEITGQEYTIKWK